MVLQFIMKLMNFLGYLKFLFIKKPQDEIIICDDYSDEKTQEVITSWTQQYGDSKVINHYQRKLDG